MAPPKNKRKVPPESSAAAAPKGKLQKSVAQATAARSRIPQFVVGIDFGTTFSTVAYTVHDSQDPKPHALWNEVKYITTWTRDPMKGFSMQVPSEIWYPSVPFLREKLAAEPAKEVVVGSSQQETPPSQTQPPQLPPSFSLPTTLTDTEASPAVLWGYDVEYQQCTTVTDRKTERLVKCAKLMLVKSEHTEEDQKVVRAALKKLIDLNLITKWSDPSVDVDVVDVADVIADILVRLLVHTKDYLRRFEQYTETCKVQFAITVPAVWTTGASRLLQEAMETAIEYTGFGQLSHGKIDNLYIVSEPEAAATYCMAQSNNIEPGEVYGILDCGGGTCDCSIYTSTQNLPLRLNDEVVPPSGDNCGSSFLNENFKERVFVRLKDESYLDVHGEDRATIVRLLVPKFENSIKRTIDVTSPCMARYRIVGLRGDQTKGFDDNYLNLDETDFGIIFYPLLHRVGDLLGTQLKAAARKKQQVKKIFLVGGFGASPSLRSFLKKYLLKYIKDNSVESEIDLIEGDPNTCVVAIAGGAVLRALDPKNGPSRFALSSFGFQRNHLHDPVRHEGHRGATNLVDPLNGETYTCVIEYFIKKGQLIKSSYRYPAIPFTHAFDAKYTGKWICDSYLWVNDNYTKDNYHFDSPENAGKQQFHEIKTDMSFLRGRPGFEPIRPRRGKPYYVVEFDLVPIVEGRNLRYEAIWKSDDETRIVSQSQVCIASAFRPGTA